MGRACATNIGARGRGLRLVAGLLALLVGILSLVGLVASGSAAAWRLALFVPFWVGAIGVFQARGGT